VGLSAFFHSSSYRYILTSLALHTRIPGTSNEYGKWLSVADSAYRYKQQELQVNNQEIMGVTTSRPSYVDDEDPVRKRQSPSLPVLKTENVSAAGNKKRRRSNEDDSPLPTGTPPLNEYVEDFEEAQRVHDQALAEELTTDQSAFLNEIPRDSPWLRDSNKDSPISPLTPLTPLNPDFNEPLGTSEDKRASFQHELRGDPPSAEAGPTVAAPLPPGTITKTRITSTTVTTTAVTTPCGKTTFNTTTTRNTTNLIGKAEGPAALDLNEFTPNVPTRVEVLRPCGGLPDVEAISTPSPDTALPQSSALSQEKRRRLRKKRRKKKRILREQQKQAQLQQQSSESVKRKNTSTGGCNNRGPRAVEYMCVLCNDSYSYTCDYNPWWSLSRHECPKCLTTQVSYPSFAMWDS
jgi:hypothetical protein